MATPNPLTTLLSQALVAHTIELDNEAEHRLPHRITRQDDPDAVSTGPWLISFALWANVLQHIDVEGSTVAHLHTRARTGELLLNGLRRWGYVTITAPAGEPLRNPPQDEATVRLRKAAREARAVWAELPADIDDRWKARLGRPAVDRLQRALRAVFDQLPIDPPDYLPVIHPTQGGKIEALRPRDAVLTATTEATTLSPLLCGVLLAFTVDVETRARISLPISANTLRVLHPTGTRIGDLPRLTGVSREANAMCAGWLERHGCAVTEPDATTRRGKVIRLTPKGARAQQNARGHVESTDEAWRTTYGAGAVDELKSALHEVVGDGTFDSSPLAPGLVPHPGNWRAEVRRPEVLPHYPMVLHRGGYPDGS
ncbi:MAG TPA: hypothetical protein VH012_07020 [Acidimicrobiales bacterium]|nr:hypothetical protein [Acidimicrobiales bacterium]